MNILALDLGTKTGYCAGSKGVHASGVWDLKPSRFDGAGMRLIKLIASLNEIHHAIKIERVYFEEVRRHMGVDAAHWFGAFWGQITKWCEENDIPYEGVPVGSIKKFFTGKGNASKDMMIDEAERRGYPTDDDNEADAIALFLMKVE